MEAEYVAAAEETKDVIWLRSLLEELGLKQTTATTVHIDNQSPINLSANPSIHARTKHINIKHHLVREQVGFGTIRLEYIETAKQRADIHQRPLAPSCPVQGDLSLSGERFRVQRNPDGAHDSFDGDEGLIAGTEL
jgi:hypothetical protein